MHRTLVTSLALVHLIALVACGGGGGGGSTARTWHDPSGPADGISPADHDARLPRVAMDVKGDAVVVWSEADGAGNNAVYLSEYRDGVWKHPAGLADHISPAGQDTGFPAVAMSANGDAVVAWNQSDGVDRRLYKSEYRHGAWTHPVSLSDCVDVAGGENAQFPEVAMDDAGDTIIVWALHSPSDSTFHLYVAEYGGGSWHLPADLDDHVDVDGGILGSQDVAMDAVGNAVVAWGSDASGDLRGYKADRRGATWYRPVSSADAISPAGGQYVTGLTVAMSRSGQALIAWEQRGATAYHVYKSEYRGGKWVHPADLSDFVSLDLGGEISPVAAMDADGDAVLAWRSTGASSQLYVSQERSGTWTGPASAADSLSAAIGQVGVPAVAMDGAGNALVAWTETSGSIVQLLRADRRNGRWSLPAVQASPAGGDVREEASAALSDDGTALLTWAQRDPTIYRVLLSQYR
jgi:hypothetical protein